jgi:hypothetical protein
MASSSHQSQVPPVVRSYMRLALGPVAEQPGHPRHPDSLHPIVRSTFVPGRGWRRYPICKAVSGAWARKAKASGVTEVQLAFAGHLADFRISELTR